MPEDISIDDQIACARRELAMRERVYPKFVNDKKMTKEQAYTQIMQMQAIVSTLQRVKASKS